MVALATSTPLSIYYPLSAPVPANPSQTDYLRLFKAFASDGILKGELVASAGQITERGAGADMSVDVAAFRCIIRGVLGEKDSTTNLVIAANGSGNPRIDRIVARLQAGTPNIVVGVVQGTPAVTPAIPALTQTVASGVPVDWDIDLGYVAVANGAVSILNANITNRQQFFTGAGFTRWGDMPSAATLRPPLGKLVLLRVTGVTGITAIEAGAEGSILVLTFASSLTVTDNGTTLNLTRDFSATADSYLVLVSDGTNWQEIARSTPLASLVTADMPTLLGSARSHIGPATVTNARMTNGLTIQQGTADNEILALKSTDVAHGITDLTETDTFAAASKQHVTAGGLRLQGFSNGGIGLNVDSYTDIPDTTKANGSYAAIQLGASDKSGTGLGAMAANSNILAVVVATAGCRFILDADGDSHQDVGTAWTNFHGHDDVALLNMLSAHVTRPNDPIREQFREWLEQNRAPLEQAKLVTFNDDGHHFINWSRTSMLMIGAITQLGAQLGAVTEQLSALEQRVMGMLPEGV